MRLQLCSESNADVAIALRVTRRVGCFELREGSVRRQARKKRALPTSLPVAPLASMEAGEAGLVHVLRPYGVASHAMAARHERCVFEHHW